MYLHRTNYCRRNIVKTCTSSIERQREQFYTYMKLLFLELTTRTLVVNKCSCTCQHCYNKSVHRFGFCTCISANMQHNPAQ